MVTMSEYYRASLFHGFELTYLPDHFLQLGKKLRLGQASYQVEENDRGDT
jgi:hypothetical protein